MREALARSRSFQRRVRGASEAMRLREVPLHDAVRGASVSAFLDSGLVLESSKTLELERALECSPQGLGAALAAGVEMEIAAALGSTAALRRHQADAIEQQSARAGTESNGAHDTSEEKNQTRNHNSDAGHVATPP